MEDYVIGLDLGTSSLKGLVVNREGSVVAESSSSYQLISPTIGYSEQNPQDWYDAAEEVFSNLCKKVNDLKENLAGISFSGQMHSLVLLDEENNVIRNAILWNDTRTTLQCEKLMMYYGEELLFITKNKALEGFTLPKILWVQENEPELWSKVRHILLPKDYLRFRLTGRFATDYSDAAGTLLFDMESNTWSTSITNKYNIPINYLPEVIDSQHFVGNLIESFKLKFGFTRDVSVFTGGADNACAALGSGILAGETGLCSIGTSGVVLGVENDKIKLADGKLHHFYHSIPETVYSMGVTLAAGSSLSWYKNIFAPDTSFNELLDSIKDVPIGSDGLLFTPYIDGERTPYTDSNVRATFFGMDRHHNFSHFTRAVIEGITFSLKDCLELIQSQRGKEFETIISIGGGAKSDIWLQIQSDIFNKDIICLDEEQGPAMGAAMLAAKGLQWYSSFDALIDEWIKIKKNFTPIPENVQFYETLYKHYKAIYPLFKGFTNLRG
ncbi:D-xylulose kinase [Streptococcus agalactiae LMG 14747]|uniref:Xylulose kinase n=1 Tax=Streptococcus agalactiae LMG 14747 TaxID=1154860 RepID=V6Z106_STRAG|nr:D-xylulose kinase [Streptococcus agalactiae LMG 14747]